MTKMTTARESQQEPTSHIPFNAIGWKRQAAAAPLNKIAEVKSDLVKDSGRLARTSVEWSGI